MPLGGQGSKFCHVFRRRVRRPVRTLLISSNPPSSLPGSVYSTVTWPDILSCCRVLRSRRQIQVSAELIRGEVGLLMLYGHPCVSYSLSPVQRRYSTNRGLGKPYTYLKARITAEVNFPLTRSRISCRSRCTSKWGLINPASTPR